MLQCVRQHLLSPPPPLTRIEVLGCFLGPEVAAGIALLLKLPPPCSRLRQRAAGRSEGRDRWLQARPPRQQLLCGRGAASRERTVGIMPASWGIFSKGMRSRRLACQKRSRTERSTRQVVGHTCLRGLRGAAGQGHAP